MKRPKLEQLNNDLFFKVLTEAKENPHILSNYEINDALAEWLENVQLINMKEYKK